MLTQERAVTRAAAALERAERDEAEKFRVIMRFTKKLKGLDTTTTSVKMMNHWIKIHEAAEECWHADERQTKDQQTELFLWLSCAREMRRAQCFISCLKIRSREHVKMRSRVDVACAEWYGSVWGGRQRGQHERVQYGL